MWSVYLIVEEGNLSLVFKLALVPILFDTWLLDIFLHIMMLLNI